MTIEEVIAEFEAQGLCMEPENDGESVDILVEVADSLAKNFQPLTAPAE